MKGEVLALAADMNEDLEVPFKELSEAFKRQIFYGSNGREVTLSYENTNGRNGTITRPVEGVVNMNMTYSCLVRCDIIILMNGGNITMKYAWLDEYCLSKKGVEKEYKLEWDATRYMIKGKMFALQGGDKEGKPIITVKLNPMHSELLRNQYKDIIPGYYMNKIKNKNTHLLAAFLLKNFNMT